ncbi:MAG: hypothetical protein FJ403_05655 [Verrucomicrobia bacterium]|nr:hypothetical protein [Verrucomicrobiota bacterium]
MNQEKLLKLQAYLDKKLPPAESAQVARWISEDEQARAVLEELTATKSLLAGNELEVKLPEGRQFYWSKIQREIARLETETAAQSSSMWHSWWARLAAPLAGAAVAIAAIIFITKPQFDSGAVRAFLQEIETPIEEASAISFHSQEAGMTVVWIESQGN